MKFRSLDSTSRSFLDSGCEESLTTFLYFNFNFEVYQQYIHV